MDFQIRLCSCQVQTYSTQKHRGVPSARGQAALVQCCGLDPQQLCGVLLGHGPHSSMAVLSRAACSGKVPVRAAGRCLWCAKPPELRTWTVPDPGMLVSGH